MRYLIIFACIVLFGLSFLRAPPARADDLAAYLRSCAATFKTLPDPKAFILGASGTKRKCYYRSRASGSGDAVLSATKDCRSAGWDRCFLMGMGENLTAIYERELSSWTQYNRQSAQRRQQQNNNNDAAATALLNGLMGGLSAGYATGSQPIQHSSPRPRPRAAPTHNGGSSDNCDWSTGPCSSQ
jgi:hypothetical protein